MAILFFGAFQHFPLLHVFRTAPLHLQVRQRCHPAHGHAGVGLRTGRGVWVGGCGLVGVGGCGRVDELVWMYVWMWMGVVCVIASKPVATCVALFTRLNSFHCVNDDVTPSLAISCHTPPPRARGEGCGWVGFQIKVCGWGLTSKKSAHPPLPVDH